MKWNKIDLEPDKRYLAYNTKGRLHVTNTVRNVINALPEETRITNASTVVSFLIDSGASRAYYKEGTERDESLDVSRHSLSKTIVSALNSLARQGEIAKDTTSFTLSPPQRKEKEETVNLSAKQDDDENPFGIEEGDDKEVITDKINKYLFGI